MLLLKNVGAKNADSFNIAICIDEYSCTLGKEIGDRLVTLYYIEIVSCTLVINETILIFWPFNGEIRLVSLSTASWNQFISSISK